MSKRLIDTLIIFIIFAPVSASSESLEPEDSVFSDECCPAYSNLVINYLTEFKEKDIRVKVIVFPSFKPEYGLGIKEKDGEYYILRVSPKIKLWNYETLKDMKNGKIKKLVDGEFVVDEKHILRLEKRLPVNPMSVDKTKCTAQIGNATAKTIINIWENMLFQTKYKKSSFPGFDGTTYHFSMKSGYQILAGKAWSPEAESKTGKLVQIVHLLEEICITSSKQKQNELKTLVSDLNNAL